MKARDDFQRQLMLTFLGEVQEYLNIMDRHLLALEQGVPTEEQKAILTDLFRVAHSMKGAARAVNQPDIEQIAHHMEDVLGALRRGDITFSPDLFDLLFAAVDAIRQALAATQRGERPEKARQEALLRALDAAQRGEPMSPVAPAAPTALPAPPTPGPAEAPGPSSPTEKAPAPPEGTRSTPTLAPASPRSTMAEETVRVTTAKLDVLMADVGELLAARMRAGQRAQEMRDLQAQLYRWERHWRQVRPTYNRLQRRDPQDPDLATLLDFLAASEEYLRGLNTVASDIGRATQSDARHLSLLADNLRNAVRQVRMVPVAQLFDIFPRMLRDLAREQGKEVTLEVEGADTEVDRQVLEALKDPLTHLLRNAVDHGIEPPDEREARGKPRRGTIWLRAAQRGNTILVEVSDDGGGIDINAVRQAAVAQDILSSEAANTLSDQDVLDLIFRSGLSTQSRVTEVSGRGIGLDVVRETLERLHGLVRVDTRPGEGTTFSLTLPLTLATSQVLLLRLAHQLVAVPTSTVERILRLAPDAVSQAEGRRIITVDGHPIPLVSLRQVLNIEENGKEVGRPDWVWAVVLGVAERRLAFEVDGFEATEEVIVKSLGSPLRRVRNVAGATILGSGDIAIVLNVTDLIRAAPAVTPDLQGHPPGPKTARRQRVLVVDDSITTRTLEKNILENAGYEVLVAANGAEAWALVESEPLDAVVADVAMPEMDGFVLTEKIRQSERFRELPIILVTSLESTEDRVRGLEAGADAYIVKRTFDQEELLETLERLIR